MPPPAGAADAYTKAPSIPPLKAVTDAATVASDETIELSPFVVRADTESGYQAKETLAGMRIKTDLKEVGAAVDVLTERFLDDVGAVDMNQALQYVPNMQYADFPGGGASDQYNNQQWYSASYMSRGVVGNSVLTDFFLTGSVPTDRYNTENMTFLRGPNAILFGIGSPSGIVGSSSKRASLSRNLHTVRFMADTFGSGRSELDISRVMFRNRLAFRLCGVASDQHSEWKPSLNRRNSIYGTLSCKPFSRTTVTVNAERGIYDRYFAMNSVVTDGYTPWVRAGRPTVNFVTGKGMINGSTVRGQFSTAVGSGLQNVSTSSYLTYIDGGSLPIMDWRNMARGSYWSDTVTAGNPGSGLVLAADRTSMASIPFTRANAIVDLFANTWGGHNNNDLTYSKRSVFLEQNLARNLDLELAWNQFNQEYIFDRLAVGVPIIKVDPNEVLPNGQPNPYLGQPYVESGADNPRSSRDWREYAAKRATLSYRLDLEHLKIFRKIGLGSYQFAGLYQDAEFDQKQVCVRYVNVTPLPGTPASTPLNQNQNRVNRRYYLQPGQSSFEGYTHVVTFRQTSVPGATVDGPLNVEPRGSDESPRNLQQSTRSVVGAVQGAWWPAERGYFHLTAMYGQRSDREADRAQSFTRQANGEYPGPFTHFDRLDEYGTWGPMTEFSPRTKTYNITARPISQLRVFYNYSNIFRATTAANFFDVFDKPLRPATGETKDYGVKFELWHDRVFATATKYETGVVDTTLDNTNSNRTPINDIYNAIGRPDLILERPFSYRDDITTGYEYSLHATVTPTWNVRVVLGTQKTVASHAFDDWVEYFAQNRKLWEANATVPLLSPSSGYRTVADAITLADTRLRDSRAVNGLQPRDQRARNLRFDTSFTFPSGLLKSVRIGGGFGWASRNVIGYARDAAGNLDVTQPFRGAERFNTSASIGYGRKFSRDRISWDIQLNLENVLNEDTLFARLAVDDGTGRPCVVSRYPLTPLKAQLTNTFRF